MVGKRKRDASVVSRPKKDDTRDESSAATDPSAQDIFRKFFEAQFEPLESKEESASQDESDESDISDNGNYNDDDDDDDIESAEHSGSESESEWSGIEGVDENTPVEVVEYQAPSMVNGLMDKKARKAFMTAKPPSFATELKSTPSHSKKPEDGDDKDETLNLKNDLALQRLLKESHLLESASDLAPSGKNRHKALDLRMQELGAKTSLFHQQKMPSSMRKGIKAKAVSKDDKRRREARENGIVLEKPAPKKHINNERRERGVGGPSIGKFSGGTLNLSKHDISQVQSSRRGGGRGRGGRGGRGRGRGKTRGGR
ncbi:hypothetical protein BJX99DRAFT_258815 [Aspergillus californicus]